MSLITKFMFSLPVSASSSSTFLGHHWIDTSVGPRIDIAWYEWTSDKPIKSTMIQWTTLSKYQSCIGILKCHSCVWFLSYPQPNHKLKESHESQICLILTLHLDADHRLGALIHDQIRQQLDVLSRGQMTLRPGSWSTIGTIAFQAMPR